MVSFKHVTFLVFTLFSTAVAASTASKPPDVLQSIISTIAGTGLGAALLLLIAKRMVKQYDDKLDNHEKMHSKTNQTLINLEKDTAKAIQEEVKSIHVDIRSEIGKQTGQIMTTLDTIKKNLQDIVTDVAVLKNDRSQLTTVRDKTEGNTSDLKVVQAQLQSFMLALQKIEQQLFKLRG